MAGASVAWEAAKPDNRGWCLCATATPTLKRGHTMGTRTMRVLK